MTPTQPRPAVASSASAAAAAASDQLLLSSMGASVSVASTASAAPSPLISASAASSAAPSPRMDIRSAPHLQQRPNSDVSANHYKSPEAEAIDRWFEDLSYYEKTLEQMAHAKLDDSFREELKAIEQWFSVLSDPERTTALYSLLQHTTPVQVRFFITVLQQMAQKFPLGNGGGVLPSSSASSRKIVSTGPAIGRDADILSHHRTPVSLPPALPSFMSSPALGPEDVIASANWSLAPGGFSLSGTGGGSSAVGSPAMPPPGTSLVIDPRTSAAAGPYARSKSPQPASPIFVGGAYRSQGAGAAGHPGDGWGHVQLVGNKSATRSVASSVGGGGGGGGIDGHAAVAAVAAIAAMQRQPPSSPAQSYSQSEYTEYSDSYDDGDHDLHDSRSRNPSTHRDKGKVPESVDFEALRDIPGWLRSLRLHKYTGVFEGMDWREMVMMTEDDLAMRGVSAQGARRKLLRIFELIRFEA
ncbi:hypothetical protein HK405_007717, partial [Cladochytrium tenue]